MAVKRKFRLAIFKIEVARQHRLAFLHDVHVRGPARLGGKNFQLDALAGAINGAFRAQQNLVLAVAGLQVDFARGVISFLIRSFDLQSVSMPALRTLMANNGNSRHHRCACVVRIPIQADRTVTSAFAGVPSG